MAITTTAPTAAPGSRLERIRASLSPAEWRRVTGMLVFIVLLTVVGWFIIGALVAPQHYAMGTGTFGVGIGLTAYTLGMRHAFDADHIAAIDNTTRKLMADGQRPLSVGFWFSLGHSSVVFGLCALLSLGVRALAGQVENSSSGLQHWTSLIGTTVSGTFLMIIAVLNAVVLWGIIKVFRQMRTGAYSEVELEEHLAKRGLMNRILAPIMRTDPDGLFGDESLIRMSCPRCGARHTITREALEAYVASPSPRT